MKFYSILTMLLISSLIEAQTINNQILGKYISKNESELYSNFIFDNNGKVLISEFSTGDYFIKGDTLIIFPDKSMFKFIIKNKELLGVSQWVKNGKWILNEEKVTDNRNDNALAQNKALILNEYYEKTRMSDIQMEIFFNENLKNEYLKTIEDLCDRGLVRACKEAFAMETLNQKRTSEQALAIDKTDDIKDNPKLLKLANNVLKLDPAEGYNLLFLYYSMTKQTDKASEASEKAIALGNKETILTKMNMEMEWGNVNPGIENKSEDTSDNKSRFEPLFISTLCCFNQQKFADIEQDINSKYGFKLIDKKPGNEVEIRDYENDKLNRITIFQYKNAKKNKVEYTTKDIEEITFLKQELDKYTLTESKEIKTGEKREDYELEIKTDKDLTQKYHIQILYPSTSKPNEPTTLLLIVTQQQD